MGFVNDPSILDLWSESAQNAALVAAGVALVVIILVAWMTRWRR